MDTKVDVEQHIHEMIKIYNALRFWLNM